MLNTEIYFKRNPLRQFPFHIFFYSWTQTLNSRCFSSCPFETNLFLNKLSSNWLPLINKTFEQLVGGTHSQ